MALDNIPYIHTEKIHNNKAAEEVLPYLFKLIPINSILDVGCGLGNWLFVAKSLGIEITKGIDGSFVNPDLLKISREDFISHDLKVPIQLERQFDLVICLEVAEHLPGESSETLIDTITNHGNVALFSAAQINQGGQNHVNEKNINYWQKKFLRKGFHPYDILRKRFWNNTDIEWWYRQNMILYAKEGILDEESVSPLDIIHPELLSLKTKQVEYLEKEIQGIKSNRPIFYLKALVKSIFRS